MAYIGHMAANSALGAVILLKHHGRIGRYIEISYTVLTAVPYIGVAFPFGNLRFSEQLRQSCGGKRFAFVAEVLYLIVAYQVIAVGRRLEPVAAGIVFGKQRHTRRVGGIGIEAYYMVYIAVIAVLIK